MVNNKFSLNISAHFVAPTAPKLKSKQKLLIVEGKNGM